MGRACSNDNAGGSQLAGLVIENAGDDESALLISAQVTLNGSTIRNAKVVGMKVTAHGKIAEMSGNTFERAGKLAISAPAHWIPKMGGNKFDGGAVVQVEGGKIEESGKWPSWGVPFVVVGDLSIGGKKESPAVLEIPAGTELRMNDANVGVGYGGYGKLGDARVLPQRYRRGP